MLTTKRSYKIALTDTPYYNSNRVYCSEWPERTVTIVFQINSIFAREVKRKPVRAAAAAGVVFLLDLRTTYIINKLLN